MFRLAPRINAAGRMSSPELATQLLLARDPASAAEAQRLAEQLDAENTRRREEEAATVDAARQLVDDDPDVAARHGLVVWGDGWHRGVIGIVASKLVDHFARPAIVLSVEDGEAHGSGRSIPGFDLLGALEQCSDLLVRFGGHRQAAGLVIETARLAEFQRRFAEHADRTLTSDDLVPRLDVDGHLPLTAIGSRLVAELNAMEPFGSGNRRPVFSAEPVEVVDGPHPLKEQHLRMTVQQGRARFRAVAWRAAERIGAFTDRGSGLNLAYSLTENTYQGNAFLQLTVADAIEAR